MFHRQSTANSFYLLQSPAHYNLFISILDSDEKFFLGFDRSNVSLEALQKRLKETLAEPKSRNFTIGFTEPGFGFVSILDDHSLIVRLQYIEQQGRNFEFSLRFDSNTTNSARTFASNGVAYVGPLDQDDPDDDMLDSFHVMLSYAWSDKDKVQIIKNELDRRGLTIWMDVTNMNKNIYEAMARGVLQSKVIVPCISLNYASRPNCRRELHFAADNNKPMVPVRLEKIPQNTSNFKLEAVKLITSGELYVDLSEQDWKNPFLVASSMDNLKDKIVKHLQDIENQNSQPSNQSLPPQDRLKNWLNPISMVDEHERLENDYVDGTRLWLIDEVRRWIETPASRVLWLNGGAGVGKSMMSYLVSTKIPQDWFGAVFYCRHNDSDKNNAVNVLKTIAFELSKRSSKYFDFLTELLENDELLQKGGKNSILLSSVSSIHKDLLIDGLKMIRTNEPIVIVIDALDECGKPGDVERAELLSVVHESALVLPSFVKLIVTGRPESDIWENLYDINAHVLETTSEQNMRDLYIFCKARISNLGVFTEKEIEQAAMVLTAKSEGVFVYARLACDNIEYESPKVMQSLMTIIQKLHTGMDSIYDSIFTAQNDATVRLVICAICSLQKPLTIKGISKILFISEPSVGGALIALRSILRTGDDGTIAVIHKSLKDYVTTPGRSSSVDFSSVNIGMVLAECCFQVLVLELRFNIVNIPKEFLHTFHTDIPNFAGIVASIPDHLWYSALYATSHLAALSIESLPIEFVRRIHKMISDIVKTKLTHWMELLSLLDRFADIIPISTSINNPTGDLPDLHVIFLLLSDAQRVCGQFAIPISACAFQVYWTAIPFSPFLTQFHQTYFDLRPPGKYPKLVQTKSIPERWSPCISTCTGHSHWVNAVAINSDGNMIVSGSNDCTVKLWNVSTGKEVRTLIGHTGPVNDVAIDSERNIVVSGSSDNTIKIWNLITGKELRMLTGHRDLVNAVVFSNERNLIVSGSNDFTVKIWNCSTGENVKTLIGHTYWVTSVAISNGGDFVVSGSSDFTVRLWNASSGNLVKTFIGHSDSVNAVAISKMGNSIVSGSDDESVKMWDVCTGREIRAFVAHGGSVNATAISNNEDFIVSGSDENTVKVWSCMAGGEIKTLTGHSHWVKTVAISNDNNLVVSGSFDGSVKIWDAAAQNGIPVLSGHTLEVTSIAICESEDLIMKRLDSGMQKQEMRKKVTTIRCWSWLWEHFGRMVYEELTEPHPGSVLSLLLRTANETGNLSYNGPHDAQFASSLSTAGYPGPYNVQYARYVFTGNETREFVEVIYPGRREYANWKLEEKQMHKPETYSISDVGWVKKNNFPESSPLFWIPYEFRGQFCSSPNRLVIFTKVVEGYANLVIVDLSDFNELNNNEIN
ncbi:POC1 centriolar protein A [Nowakowskiella sp. JEL0407]|nr:POC1 centriolar protein A [Nowakowskiella sp. JEL0407]